MARIKVAVEVLRVREVKRALDRASADIRSRAAEATRQTAHEVAAGARSRVPVRTGELRNTIRVEPTRSPFVWVVEAGFGSIKRRRSRAGAKRRRGRVTSIEQPGVYAAVVEFGSRGGHARQPAQPFMFPALEAARAGHIARVSKAIKQACDAAGDK